MIKSTYVKIDLILKALCTITLITKKALIINMGVKILLRPPPKVPILLSLTVTTLHTFSGLGIYSISIKYIMVFS